MTDLQSTVQMASKPKQISQPTQVENQNNSISHNEEFFCKRKIDQIHQDDSNKDVGKLCNKDEISQRKIFKAKRDDSLIGTNEESKTQQISDINKNAKGSFLFNQGLSLNSSNSNSVVQAEVKYKFNFTNLQQKGQNVEENKTNDSQNQNQRMEPPTTIKSMKLQDEAKFFINKNLFSKPSDEKFCLKKSDTKSQESPKRKDDELVSQNPLNSSLSLLEHKSSLKGDESPIVKSLFDFKENEKFKTQELKPVEQPKRSFYQFLAPSINANKEEKKEGESENKSKTIFNVPNPFKNYTGISPIFSTGATLFQTNNLNPLGNLNKPKPKETEEDDEDELLKPEEKENIQSNSQFEKLYQKQVEKIKILKGVASADKQPSKKDLGYLSIEKMKNTSDQAEHVHFVVYRNFLGANLFQGIINKSVAKVKEIDSDPNKQMRFKVKVAVACKDQETLKYVPEHLEIKFSTDVDRKNFIKVFNSVTGNQQS